MSLWTSEAVKKFWDAMAGIYGKRIYSEYGEDMPDAWRTSVTQLSYAQAKYGLDQCTRSMDQFVPTLPQFMYRARSMPKPQAYAALPRPAVDKEAQRARLKQATAEINTATGRRCILLPGECYADYQRALQASGMKEQEFKTLRLSENGWSEQDETDYRRLAHVIGYRL